MDVLVDTSVWADHFRNGNADLVDLMARDAVLIHPNAKSCTAWAAAWRT